MLCAVGAVQSAKGVGGSGREIFVLVHEVSQAEELAERRLQVTAAITSGSRSMSTARGAYFPPEASW